MGLVKADWMDAEERRWCEIDKFVCSRCVEDPALKRKLHENARSRRCDYCGRRGMAAPVEVLQEAIYSTVWTYFHEPASAGVPWDGGFIIEPIDIEEVLDQLGFVGHDDLFADIVNADMGQGWVAAANGHWASGHDHQVMLESWATFSEVVKHSTRFHFALSGESAIAGPQEVEPGRMLAVLGSRLRAYERELAPGTTVYRVRVRGAQNSWRPGAESLGAPPPAFARAGRMNPAGIPYLYAAFNTATALREAGVTSETVGDVFVATFVASKSILVIDLTQLPTPPSIFDSENKDEREKILFAHGFVNAISRPVKKDGQEHIEYVPPQVVCEYLAQIFKPRSGKELDGLIFPSSVEPGGRNLVVFPSDRGPYRNFRGVEYIRAKKTSRR